MALKLDNTASVDAATGGSPLPSAVTAKDTATKMVFIEPDPFAGTATKAQAYVPNYYKLTDFKDSDLPLLSSAERSFSTASRPVTGIEAKPNTFAIVQVLKADGTPVKVFNRLGQENGGKSNSNGKEPNDTAWTDWLLTSVHEERAEKTQIVETFGDTYLFAFGQRPRMLQFAGLLFNTVDYNWKAIFWENWDNYFRATKLLEQNARMYILFDDVMVEGYPLNAAADQSSSDNNALTFSFSFFVTNYTNLTVQRGFDTARNATTELVKAGYPSTDQFEITDTRRGLFDLLTGAANTALVPFGGPTLASAAISALNIATGISPLPNPDGAVAQAAQQIAAWEAFGVNALENKLNLKHGELTTWFGYLASVLAFQGRKNPDGTAAQISGVLSGGIADAIHKAFGPAAIGGGPLAAPAASVFGSAVGKIISIGVAGGV